MKIQLSNDSEPQAAETVDCDDDNYWSIRLAVDAFIAKHELTPGERVSVGGIVMYRSWIVRTRVVRAANGKSPVVLHYGEVR